MKAGTQKSVDLGRKSGEVTIHMSGDGKRVLFAFATDPKGLDKAGLGAFIDALVKIRDKMDR